MRARVSETMTELPPLAIAAASSMVLVAGLAFAVQEERPAASIATAGWVVLGAAAVAALGIAVLQLLRLPRRELEVDAEAGSLRVGGRAMAFRAAFAVRGAVEVERARSTLLLQPGNELDGRRLAGLLQAPAVLTRFRLRADYLRFVITIWAWLAVYGALCLLPALPGLGVVVTLLLLPVASLVTLQAIPGTVVVTPEAVITVRRGRKRVIPVQAIEAVRVRDDLHVLLYLAGGEELVIGELHEHPREPQAATTDPPAARLEASLQGLIAGAGSRAAR